MTDDNEVIKDKIHLALVPDGNRRYAVKNNRPIWSGHRDGAKKIEEFIEWCTEYSQIKSLSIFALSIDNLKRDKIETNELWRIYKEKFNEMAKSKNLKKHGMKVNIIGDKQIWRSDVSQAAKDVMLATAGYSRMILNILLAYGSTFEITNAIQKIVNKGIKKFTVTDDLLNEYLIISQPVDLIIRTGDQYRLSNFLLYQSAYAEIYFSKTLWPEFTKEEFASIMEWFSQQQKKFGK